MNARTTTLVAIAIAAGLMGGLTAADVGAPAEINKKFEHPDVPEFVQKFEGESREIFTQRDAIVAACKLEPGMDVADVGAGTGLFTRLMAAKVAPKGKVYAADISREFVDHILATCKAGGISNAEGVVCTQTSSGLKKKSVDFVFICDTYHHFEHPAATMKSIVKAMRPGARLVLVDFKRGDDASDFVKGHVRADKDVFRKEIEEAGLEFVSESPILKENYFLTFQKAAPKTN